MQPNSLQVKHLARRLRLSHLLYEFSHVSFTAQDLFLLSHLHSLNFYLFRNGLDLLLGRLDAKSFNGAWLEVHSTLLLLRRGRYFLIEASCRLSNLVRWGLVFII
jgi:hypothetical protein